MARQVVNFKKLSDPTIPSYNVNGDEAYLGAFQDQGDGEELVRSTVKDLIQTAIPFQTKAEMLAEPSPSVNKRYIVTNDTTNNGYYGYNGSSFYQEEDLAEGVIEEDNPNAVSGGTVYDESTRLEALIIANENQITANAEQIATNKLLTLLSL